MANENLHKAKEAKNDEFYTQLSDVAEELRHYKEHFKGKVVFCNCDDPSWSAFWRYFHLNFEHLGLKKLIATHYDKEKPTYKMEYEGGDDNDVEAGVKTPLEGNGDFRNQECIDLLKEADIVVTIRLLVLPVKILSLNFLNIKRNFDNRRFKLGYIQNHISTFKEQRNVVGLFCGKRVSAA